MERQDELQDPNESIIKKLSGGDAVSPFERVENLEVIDGKEWIINVGYEQPRVDLTTRTMWIPPGNTMNARSLVRHELGHVLWSPEKVPTGDNQTLYRALEEALVNCRWKHLSKPVKFDSKELRDVAKSVLGDSTDSAFEHLVNQMNFWGQEDTTEGGELGEKFFTSPSNLKPEHVKFYAQVRSMVEQYAQEGPKKDEEGIKRRRKIIRKITDFFRKEEPAPQPQPQAQGVSQDEDGENGGGTPAPADPKAEAQQRKKQKTAEIKRDIGRAKEACAMVENARQELSSKLAVAEHKRKKEEKQETKYTGNDRGFHDVAPLGLTKKQAVVGKPVGEISPGNVPPPAGATTKFEWNTAQVFEPLRTVPLVSVGFSGRKNMPTEIGVALKRPYGLYTDGKMFVSKNQSKGGGTVLIDWSGSMSLTTEMVIKLVSAAPRRTTVAFYSSRHSKPGRIVILAKNGKMVDGVTHTLRDGEQNLIDYPAVRWLGSQPGPRYWVTDGHVTGFETIDEVTGTRLIRRPGHPSYVKGIMDICVDKKIYTVTTIRDTIEMMYCKVPLEIPEVMCLKGHGYYIKPAHGKERSW